MSQGRTDSGRLESCEFELSLTERVRWFVMSESLQEESRQSTVARLDFRTRLNDGRRRRSVGSRRQLTLVCECGDPACHTIVRLTPQAYDVRRPKAVLHRSHRQRVVRAD